MSLEETLAGLNNPDPKIRQETIRELVRRRASPALEILRQVAARDPDAEVRTLAAGAIDFFERQAIVEARGRRSANLPPDLSEQAIEKKLETIRQRQISLAEYVLLGIIGMAAVILFIFLVYNGIRALLEGERIDTAPERPRDAVLAEMRQRIDATRAAAELLQQLPTLITEDAAGFDCAGLTDIPATYTLNETTREANPDLETVQKPLNSAHNWINDVEERWRRHCQETGGRLTAVPDHIVNTGQDLLIAGQEALDKAERAWETLNAP